MGEQVEITTEDLLQALAQKEVAIIGLNKRIAQLQRILADLARDGQGQGTRPVKEPEPVLDPPM